MDNLQNAENAPVQGEISTVSTEELQKRYKEEQDLFLGAGAAFVAAIVGGIIWATVTVLTKYQIGYMAVAVGFLVGFANRFMGKGVDQIFGIMGAFFALFGCVIGNFFSVVAFAANAEGVGYFDLLQQIEITAIPGILIETFSPMDVLFYALAIYEGYRFSFRVD